MNIAAVLCSQSKDVSYNGTAWMLQLVTIEKCEIWNQVDWNVWSSVRGLRSEKLNLVRPDINKMDISKFYFV